jgi:hypothetical protein
MPIFILIVLSIVATVVALNLYSEHRTRQKKVREIKEKWGKPTDDERVMRLVSLYKDYSGANGGISGATGEDIDMEQLFAFADRASSKPGQQYLYKKLHEPLLDVAILKQMDAGVNALAAGRQKQEDIEVELSKLGHKNAYYLPELFLKELLPLFDPLVAVYMQFSWLIMITLLLTLIFASSPLCFLMLLFLAILNIGLHYSSKGKIAMYTHSLPQLPILYDVGRWLLKNTETNRSDKVTESVHNLGKLKRSLYFVSFQNSVSGDPTDILFAVIELIKAIFLLEGLMFIRSIKEVKAYRDDIKNVYEYVAGIDMLICIDSVRKSLPYYCTPVFTNNNELDIKGLYHPLIADCVPNSIVSTNYKGVW